MRSTLAIAGLIALTALVAGCGPLDDASTDAPADEPGTTATAAATLVDVAEDAGIDFRHLHGGRGKKFLFETMGSGVAVCDFDGDGRSDVLLLQSGTFPEDEFDEDTRRRAPFVRNESAALYLNRGDWRFDDATAGSGLDEPFYAMGLAVGDVDADGDRDVYAAAYGRDRLYVNDGDARFDEVTAAAGLEDERWNVGGAFVDVDLDGDLDLYTVAYLHMPVGSHRFCGPTPELRTYCHVDGWDGIDDRLWLNDGAGRFTDGSIDASLKGTRGKGLAVIGGDWDDDGDVDLFVANDSEPNLLLRNDGGGHLANVGRIAGADLNGEGRTEACMGADLGDLDGDGDLDLFVVNFERESNTLYRNDGGGFFTDVSNASGIAAPSIRWLGFGALFFDVENDGDLDIYVANGHILDNVDKIDDYTTYAQPDQLFLNDGRGRFTPAPESMGTSLAESRVGRGAARGDLDGDGDLDLVVNNNNGRPWVLRNDVAQARRVVLRLHGPGGRADAEGARVTVRAGDLTQMREIPSGGSYVSHSDAAVVVGLGDAGRVDELSIRWPGGPTSQHGPLDADHVYTFAFGGELLASEPLAAPSGEGSAP